MKKILFSLFAATALLLTSCLEITQEITLKQDGSGTVSNKNDMSQMIGVAKQMGGAEELEKAGDEKLDSTVSMEQGADSIPNLTPEEREMARKGTLNIKFDMKAEQAFAKLDFPFSSPAEIAGYNQLSNKILAETMKEQMGDGMGAETSQISSFDDYFTYQFSKGNLTKKLNKEKYAGAESDEYLRTIKEAGGLGLVMKANYIINLPAPAKSAEGKGVKLSEDKMKVTITASVNDFFEDPSLFEFAIKY